MATWRKICISQSIVLCFIQLPNYKGFKGTIEEITTNQYMNIGEVAIIDSTTIEISELPVKTWTQVSSHGHLIAIYPFSSLLFYPIVPFVFLSNIL